MQTLNLLNRKEGKKSQKQKGHSPVAMLELVKENRIYELLGSKHYERYEASGVCAVGDYFYVIFDNVAHIARFPKPLDIEHPDCKLYLHRGENPGFEDITFQEREKKFLIIAEALEFSPGVFKPKIEEYDENLNYLDFAWVNFVLAAENKGMEGLTYVHRNGQDYALGLCEGNFCQGGEIGRKPGGGRIQILQRSSVQWEFLGTIKLPKSLLFVDYAGLDVVGDRIVVVSQENSELWVGEFKPGSWTLVDDGKVYQFPKNEKGKTLYGNIEGVSLIDSHQVVVVSDKKTKSVGQPNRYRTKDQSIHIFNIPN